MARFNPNHDSIAVLTAAQLWLKRCWLEDGSVLSNERLWTEANLEELKRNFVDQPDESSDSFYVKLEQQLSDASSESKKLMAEALWALMLFQSNIHPEKKRDRINEVWSWSGDSLVDANQMLADSVLGGLASPGVAFNTLRWRELGYLIKTAIAFKREEASEREELLREPWRFAEWLASTSQQENRQFRHIIKHLAFPDSFERIAVASDERAIVAAFEQREVRSLKKWSDVQLDRALLNLRTKLATERGTSEFDFYDQDLKQKWKAQKRAWLLAWNPRKWQWETFGEDLAAVKEGRAVTRQWACSSQKPQVGDDAWVVRVGVNPRVIFAHAEIAAEPAVGEHWDRGRAQDGETHTFVDIQIDDLRDPNTTSAVPVELLTEKLGDVQNWTPQNSGIEIKAQAEAVLAELWQARLLEDPNKLERTHLPPAQRIFVFTAGNEEARAHLRDSIESAVPLEKAIRTFPAEQHSLLRELQAREGGLYAWGAIPGPQNTARWNQMSVGDWVLGVFDSTYHYVAQVTARFDNERFSRDVWQQDATGRTWNLMYFLTRPIKVSVPVSALSDYLNAGYMGFFSIGPDRLSKITRDFGSVEAFVRAKLLADFVEIPDGITRDDVINAMVAIDTGEGSEFGDSTGYDLLHEKRRYAPKRVMGLAVRRILGRTLKPSEFTGGEGSKCFRILRGLDFEIVPKQLGGFYFIRSNVESPYHDEIGSVYHFTSTVPNSSKLRDGAYVVIDRKTNDGPQLIGFGILGAAKVSSTEDGRTNYESPFLSWTPITPSRQLTSEEAAMLRSQPSYNAQHAIRPISEQLYKLLTASKDELIMSLKEVVDAFGAALIDSNLSFGDQHVELSRAFIVSLATKPLAILTGQSGSGKTQIAIKFGEWLGRDALFVAAVRPDWTGAESVFGYEDALRPLDAGRSAWNVPAILEFLLKATGDPANPYLLVLDEMNLAHVERYFADVLSGMESGQPCLPNLVRDSDGVWRQRRGHIPRLRFPDNLFIVGTVNVDETTYMFSPKVLDRANTFEFRVRSIDLIDSCKKPLQCQAGDPALARTFLTVARDSNWQAVHQFSRSEALAAHLRRLHEILFVHQYEFGHRVFYESLRFAAMHENAGDSDLKHILDRIVMQKILPRLHGSRRRLELPIRALAYYCYHLPDDIPTSSAINDFSPEAEDIGNANLPNSFDKSLRMVRSLRVNQFASYTE
jgi:5-methylcytosine-specific restriction enzyme B